ncbi:hypothetical protein DXG01_004801 [Tephrocybe rancida]|nr:hypothetical protein DXG01_004801 [Tephrocybe rancida]
MDSMILGTFIIAAPNQTSHNDPHSKDAMYSKIQAEIRAHEEAIQLLRVRHNSLSVTRPLPPEVLSIIFHWIAVVEPDSNFLSWISVSYVCQRWRRVALECPALWGLIQFKHLNWVAELLPRSRTALLDVQFEDGASTRSSVNELQNVLAEFHRFRSLSLSPFKATQERVAAIKAVLSKPAPVLEAFIARRDVHELIIDSILPMNLFDGCAPRLRTLELEGCKISSKLPFFTGLTTFKLRYKPMAIYRPEYSKIFDTNDLISALASMPLLETLVLCNPQDSGSTGFDSDGIAELPNLRCLEVENIYYEHESLLNRMAYPQNARQKFILTSVFNDGMVQQPQMWASCLHGLGQEISKHVLPGRCFRIWDELSSTHVAIWERGGHASCPPTELPNLQFTISPPHDPDSLPYPYLPCKLLCLCSIWDALSLALLESLHVESTINRALWLDFGGKKTLKNIRLKVGTRRTIDSNFVEAFQSGIPDNDIASERPAHPKPSRIRFKSLDKLILDGWSSRYIGFGQSTISWLYPCLRERRKRGFGIKKLCFLHVGGSWDKSFEKLISSVVSHVYWDTRGRPVGESKVTVMENGTSSATTNNVAIFAVNSDDEAD